VTDVSGTGDRRERLALGGAWLVAATSTAGSLYYGSVMGLYPCRLCWFQRVAMYPLVVVLGVALWHRVPVGRLVLPLSLSGAALAAYHSWLQIAAGGTCSIGGCGAVQYRLSGLTIPNQALLGFVAVSVAVGYVAVRRGAPAEVAGRLGSGSTAARSTGDG